MSRNNPLELDSEKKIQVNERMFRFNNRSIFSLLLGTTNSFAFKLQLIYVNFNTKSFNADRYDKTSDLPFKTGLPTDFVDPLSDFCGVVGDSESSEALEGLQKEGTNSVALTFNVENFADTSSESFAPCSLITSAWLSQESGAPLLDILKTENVNLLIKSFFSSYFYDYSRFLPDRSACVFI